MNIPLSFGSALKRWRKLRDLTQGELADRTGYSLSTIRKLESGVLRPSRQVARLLSAALQLPPPEHASFLQLARGVATAVEDTPGGKLLFSGTAEPRFPALLTPLFGRSEAIATISDLLLQSERRLLTLTGPGGVGKTRLAVAVANEIQDAFPDGVVVVALAHIRNVDLVGPTIAHTLGLHVQRPDALVNELVTHLHAKRMLLVLDNLEHLLGATTFITEFIERTSRVKLLVTSRVHLKVRNELVVPVAPLPLPSSDLPPPIEHLATEPAVMLFVERAQAVYPSFQITSTTLAAVCAVCRHLDGLPLAIELAAARTRLLPPLALAERITQRLPLLTNGSPDTPERQHTLRNTIAWSYDLLDPDAQTVFARLAVFVGGWTVEGAEAVCVDHVSQSVLDVLTTLLDSNLIVQVDQDDRVTRLAMLETIREYAHERLLERPDEVMIRRRHLAYYLSLAESATGHYHGPDEGRWLTRLETDHDNLRAAVRWAQEQGLWEVVLQLAGALSHFWSRRGYWLEGYRWLETALLHAEDVARSVRLSATLGAMDLSRRLGNAAAYAAWTQESLHMAEELDDQPNVAYATMHLGAVAHDQGDVVTARSCYEASLTRARAAGDDRRAAIASYNLWRLEVHLGHASVGRRNLEESIALLRRVGDQVALAQALNDLGAFRAEVEQRYAEARTLTEEGLALSRALQDVWGTHYALRNLGEILVAQGELVEARRLFSESLAIARRYEHLPSSSFVLIELGNVALAEGDLLSAQEYFKEGLRLSREAQELWPTADALRCLARVAYVLGDRERTKAYCMESLATIWNIQKRHSVPICLLGIAWARAPDDPLRAAHLLGTAESHLDAPDFGMALFYGDRVDANAMRADLSRVLNDDPFHTARTAGRSLSLEHVVNDILLER